MIKHNSERFNRRLQKCVQSYFQGHFEQSLSHLRGLDSSTLTPTDAVYLERFMGIFYLGQLLDLPSLHAILSAHGIESNCHQVHYKKLCKKLTNNKFRLIFESLFAQILSDKLRDLSTKSASTWSRMEVTAVLDDSIFRQWLAGMVDDEFYKLWFSGQFGRTVFGFKVLTFGLVIDGFFFRFFLILLKKGLKMPLKLYQLLSKLLKNGGHLSKN
jgi:hypothetical protein